MKHRGVSDPRAPFWSDVLVVYSMDNIAFPVGHRLHTAHSFPSFIETQEGYPARDRLRADRTDCASLE